MAEEHAKLQEADDLLKFANKLDPNSTLELEIEWYMTIKHNGCVQQALNVVSSCKPFLSKVVLIMKYVHDIVTIAKNRNMTFQQISQLIHHLLLIYQSFVKILKTPNQIHQKIRTGILHLIMNLLEHPLRDKKH
jgi:hypothetical protein